MDSYEGWQFVGATIAAGVLVGFRQTSEVQAVEGGGRCRLFWGDLHRHDGRLAWSSPIWVG